MSALFDAIVWMQSPCSVIMTPDSTRESPPVKRQLFLLTAALNSSWDLTPSQTEAMVGQNTEAGRPSEAMRVQGSEALLKQRKDAADGKRVTRRRFAGVLALLACITIVTLVGRPHDSLLPINSSSVAHQTSAERIDSNKKLDEASEATMQLRRKMVQKIREENSRLKAESERAEEALPSGSITRRSKPMAAVAKVTRVAVPLMASVTVLCQALLPTLILVPSSPSVPVLVPLVAAALMRAATVGLGVRAITHGKLGTVWLTLASTPLLTPQLFIANVVAKWVRQQFRQQFKSRTRWIDRQASRVRQQFRQQFKSRTRWIEQRPHALRRWIDRQASRLVPVVVRHHV